MNKYLIVIRYRGLICCNSLNKIKEIYGLDSIDDHNAYKINMLNIVYNEHDYVNCMNTVNQLIKYLSICLDLEIVSTGVFTYE